MVDRPTSTRKLTDVACRPLMALSRRAFLAAAAAGLAACSKSVHRVVGSASTTVAPSGVTPGRPTTTAEHVGPAALAYSGPRGRKRVASTFNGPGPLLRTQGSLTRPNRSPCH